MTKQHNRRIYAGYYKKYDGNLVYVIRVMKAEESDVEYVVGMYYSFSHNTDMFLMTKESFCEMVEFKGKLVDKFVRQTQMSDYSAMEYKLRGEGFPPPRKRYYVPVYERNLTKDDDKIIKEIKNQIRYFRRAETYFDYAKDLCINFIYDRRRFNLCVSQKRLIGVNSIQDFEALKEDLAFFKACYNTVLSPYKEFFKERFIQRYSIREYANKHNINRGSVEYMQKKLFAKLAYELEQRDKTDGKIRIIK